MQICNADMQCRYVKEICNNAVRGSVAPGTNIYPQRRAITAAQAAEAEEAAEAAEAAAEAAEAAEAATAEVSPAPTLPAPPQACGRAVVRAR